MRLYIFYVYIMCNFNFLLHYLVKGEVLWGKGPAGACEFLLENLKFHSREQKWGGKYQ